MGWSGILEMCPGVMHAMHLGYSPRPSRSRNSDEIRKQNEQDAKLHRGLILVPADSSLPRARVGYLVDNTYIRDAAGNIRRLRSYFTNMSL
jgi:hypothetical protein